MEFLHLEGGEGMSGTALTETVAGSQQPDIPNIHPDHHDLWTWEALYNDGTTLSEVDGATYHSSTHIDHERVIGFVLRPLIPGYPQFGIQLNSGKRLVFVRRRIVPLDTFAGERQTWHILGWKRGEEDYFLTYVHENGDSFTTDDFNANLTGGEELRTDSDIT